MSSFETAGLKDFSSILDESGRVYHLRGDYSVYDDGTQFLPVNRSYVPLYTADTLLNNIDAPYTKDRIMHDEVTDSTLLKGRERAIPIVGKQLLFLANSVDGSVVTYDPRLASNIHLSGESRRVCEQLTKGLARRKVEIELGVLGSHQTGLDGPESDMDLIMWTGREQRADTLRAVYDTFKEMRYSDPNLTRRLLEYSTRIANLGSLSVAAGAYLAHQRLRWISPQGVSTSLQCLHSDYDHSSTKNAIDPLLNNDYQVVEEVTERIVEVMPTSDPYNFPRRWDVLSKDDPAVVVGFDWAHQGMGTTIGKSTKFVVRAAMLEDGKCNKMFILNKPGDYILPIDVAYA